MVGSIDEDKVQAQAFTRERKLAVAQRSVELLTGKYGIPPEDIIIDPLVFPCATGDVNYIGGGGRDHRRHPPGEGAHTLRQDGAGHFEHLVRTAGGGARSGELGVSVLLHEGGARPGDCERREAGALRFDSRRGAAAGGEPAVQFARRGCAGRIAAHRARGLARSRAPEQKAAINQWHIAAITEHFRKAGTRTKQRAEDLPLDQRLANYIIEGTKDGLIADLDRKLAEGAAPLDIVNGPLMAGMSEVGRLFNNNELIVAEVLQSAEAMKAAVSYLEQFMEKADTAARGKVILATVKGDVHDIGKNLVEIILANNGYQVVNLGIKVPPDALIRAYQEHQPDAIGLSGLLVKSTQQMVVTATDLKTAGIAVPLLVGGAALSEKFTRGEDRAGVWRGGVLRQGCDDRPER